MKLITLLESRQTEEVGKNILRGKEIPENDIQNIINDFKNGDTSQNQKNIPLMCFFYDPEINTQQIINEINDFNSLMNDKKITTENFGKMGLTVKYKGPNNTEVKKTFNSSEWISFTELIHGLTNVANVSRKRSTNYDISKYDEEISSRFPLYMKGENIKVYEAKGKEDCINYTHNLRKKSYRFCIGKPNPVENMYDSYRTKYSSKFYFIVDLNRMDIDNDPLHMVVLQTDLLPYKSIKLTDANNTTGNIAEYGREVDGYLNYLKSKGIDIDKFGYSPLTDTEIHTNNLVKQPISSLETLLSLDDASKPEYVKPKVAFEQDVENYYLRQYIDRGHTFTDEQFNYFLQLSADM